MPRVILTSVKKLNSYVLVKKNTNIRVQNGQSLYRIENVHCNEINGPDILKSASLQQQSLHVQYSISAEHQAYTCFSIQEFLKRKTYYTMQQKTNFKTNMAFPFSQTKKSSCVSFGPIKYSV